MMTLREMLQDNAIYMPLLLAALKSIARMIAQDSVWQDESQKELVLLSLGKMFVELTAMQEQATIQLELLGENKKTSSNH